MQTGARVPDRVQFLDVPLLNVSTTEFIALLIGSASAPQDTPAFFTYINAWCTVVAQRDFAYLRILQQATGVYADGQAIVWATTVLGNPVPERVNAADFIVEFCRQAAAANLSLYLIGSGPDIARNAAAQWKMQVPELRVAGAEDGYFGDGGDAVLARIEKASPDVLLLGLGVPLQETWATDNLSRIRSKSVWCVGAMFEYHGKARARAPKWMRRCGLEWLFRLVLEPRRLAHRYLIGNMQFLFYVIRAKLIATKQ